MDGQVADSLYCKSTIALFENVLQAEAEIVQDEVVEEWFLSKIVDFREANQQLPHGWIHRASLAHSLNGIINGAVGTVFVAQLGGSALA